MSSSDLQKARPWYKYPAVWMIIALPAISVLMSFGLLYESISSTQSPPIESYFKKGLSPNQLAEKEEKAKELGLEADLLITNGKINVTTNQAINEPVLEMIYRHPTLADKDFTIALVKSAPKLYTAKAPSQLNENKWDIFVKSGSQNWQIEARRLVNENKLKLTPYGE